MLEENSEMEWVIMLEGGVHPPILCIKGKQRTYGRMACIKGKQRS
jgi:hypothetical protein